MTAGSKANPALVAMQQELAEVRAMLVAVTSSEAAFMAQTGAMAAQIATLEARIGRGGRGGGTGAAGAMGNLTAQFNDIGVMMAAGQNPFMLAIQQGTQISQVIGPMGAGGAVKALGAAFVSMLNPVSLVTIGVIAGAAALVQWGAAALGAGEDTETLEKRIKKLQEATQSYDAAALAARAPISELRVKYGELADEIQRVLELKRDSAYFDARAAVTSAVDKTDLTIGFSSVAIRNLAAEQARIDAMIAKIETTKAALNDDNAKFFDFTSAYAEIDEAIGNLDDLKRAVQDVADTYAISADQAQQLALASAQLTEAKGTKAQVVAGTALLNVMVEVFGSIQAADAATDGLATKLSETALAGGEIARVDIASGIGAGANEAARLAGNLLSALSLKNQMAAQTNSGGRGDGMAELAYRRTGVNPDAGRFVYTGPSLDRLNNPAVSGSAGGFGGASAAASDSLASLQKEAAAALKTLDVAIAAINEKVRAGLMSTAQGEEAITSAKTSAANATAELIAKMDALGPKGAAAVAQTRTALKGLVVDLGTTGSELSDKLAGGFESAFADFITGAGKGKDAMADFGNFVLATLADIAAAKFSENVIGPLFDSIAGAVSGAVSGVKFAKGGLPGGPGIAAYSGSIIDRPTFFPMAKGAAVGLMGEAGPEAVMPLRRGPGGVLGVLAGGGGGGGDVIVNVHAPAGGAAPQVSQRSDGKNRMIEVMFEQAEAMIAGNLQRGVGPVSDVLSSSYSLSRQPR